MSKIIMDFYKQHNSPDFLLNQKVAIFERNADIAAEFEYWILNKAFKTEDAVEIEGYTAKRLAETFEYLNGDGAFLMLVDLKENPDRALAQLSEGFKIK